MALVVLLICFCLHQARSDVADKKVVQVEQGMLEGLISVIDTGMKIVTYNSVPYAKPPIGPLRFKAPQPPEKWDGVRPADVPFRSCPQTGESEEDCLLLNIVTPLDSGDKLPVMIWIHGGAFFIGSASLEMYDLEYFVKQGIVIVSINYRLSALGFLSLNGSDVTPNAGLKDQVAAMRWVKRNIASFGGDPDNITLFGESAGAASVQYHIISPMTKGLFNRAIMQSGSACNAWAFREPNQNDAFKLGESLGKKTSDPQELADFLRSLPAQDIVDSVFEAWSAISDGRDLEPININTVPFLPTVEYPVPDGESFEEIMLPERPDMLLKQGRFNKVPQIIGMNSLEAAFLKTVPLEDKWTLLESKLEILVPVDLGLQAGSPASNYVAGEIREFFFHNQTFGEHSLQPYLELSSDADWTRRLSECAKYTASHQAGQLWVYYFTYFGNNSITRSKCDGATGAAHYDEVPLMFKDNPLGGEYTADDKVVQKYLLKMWTSFAAKGRPDTGTEVQWTPVEDASCLSHLVIDTQLSMDQSDLRGNYTSFWTKVAAEAAKLR